MKTQFSTDDSQPFQGFPLPGVNAESTTDSGDLLIAADQKAADIRRPAFRALTGDNNVNAEGEQLIVKPIWRQLGGDAKAGVDGRKAEQATADASVDQFGAPRKLMSDAQAHTDADAARPIRRVLSGDADARVGRLHPRALASDETDGADRRRFLIANEKAGADRRKAQQTGDNSDRHWNFAPRELSGDAKAGADRPRPIPRELSGDAKTGADRRKAELATEKAELKPRPPIARELGGAAKADADRRKAQQTGDNTDRRWFFAPRELSGDAKAGADGRRVLTADEDAGADRRRQLITNENAGAERRRQLVADEADRRHAAQQTGDEGEAPVNFVSMFANGAQILNSYADAPIDQRTLLAATTESTSHAQTPTAFLGGAMLLVAGVAVMALKRARKAKQPRKADPMVLEDGYALFE